MAEKQEKQSIASIVAECLAGDPHGLSISKIQAVALTRVLGYKPEEAVKIARVVTSTKTAISAHRKLADAVNKAVAAKMAAAKAAPAKQSK